MMHHRSKPSSAATGEVQRLLGYMPLVVRSAGLTDWERQFCVSICGRLKRGTFTPSENQVRVMTRLVAAFQAAMRDDGPLIEDDDADA